MNQEIYPLVVPRLLFNGLCSQALKLYKKAFGAEVKKKNLFFVTNLRGFQCKNEDEKNFVYYAELMIEKQLAMMCLR